MNPVVVAHIPKGPRQTEQYAMYRDGKLVATWDSENMGFDLDYIFSQAKRWCLPHDEVDTVEMKGKAFPKTLPKSVMDIEAPEEPFED